MMFETLRQRVRDKSARIAIVGLGYVGLPVACSFARAGFRVVGIRRDARKVALINSGISPIEGNEPGLAELLAAVVKEGRLRASTEYGECRAADVILVAVETPVDAATKEPDYRALQTALRFIGRNLKTGGMVIVESTLSPGTMKRIVQPTLQEASGLRAGEDFLLATCPERVMPGKLLANIRSCSRVIGGTTAEAGEIARDLYRHVVDADLDVTDCLTAELVKTTENAYRDVQIAFANEVALLCQSLGADVWRVRELVNKSPGRQMHLPGTGVGGHCIPKDPWLLVAGAGDDFVARLICAARAVNDGMPYAVAALARKALSLDGLDVRGARVAVLGYAYLEDSDDDRNSPSAPLVHQLQAWGAEVSVHDPYVKRYISDITAAVAGQDLLVFAVAHRQYRELDLDMIRRLVRRPTIVDARAVLDEQQVRARGFRYLRLGSGCVSIEEGASI